MELLIKTKKKKQKKKIEITIKKTVLKLFVIMKKHIGSDNAIQRDELFYKVFGIYDTEISELYYIVLWDILRKAMHRCRQRTKCFITNYSMNKSRFYFVVKDHNDAQYYSTIARNTITRLKAMEKRAYRSVTENWHKKEWEY